MPAVGATAATDYAQARQAGTKGLVKPPEILWITVVEFGRLVQLSMTKR